MMGEGAESMSRSHKKTPISGITTARSDKQDKTINHRQERTSVRNALSQYHEPLKWPRGQYFEKDGKMRFDPEKHPKLMRK
jgi:hypothetical protein